MRCLLIAPEAAPYVRRDAEILARRHMVELLTCHRLADYRRLPGAVARAEVIVIWFAKLHALAAVELARLLKRPTVVVIAGDDVCAIPAVGYGMFSHAHKAWCPKHVLRHASAVIAVSRHARESARLQVQGCGYWPVVYQGFDGERLAPLPGVQRRRLVLSAARVTREALTIKGLRLLAETARRLPDVPFVLLGGGEARAEAELDRLSPSNLSRLGWVSEAEMIRWASASRVYLQPSLVESFGAAVAEAMLCGAIPVVPRRGALPEVVGRAGVYADDLSPDTLAEAVRRGLALGSEASRAARKRILEKFSFAGRERGLEGAISRAVSGGRGQLPRPEVGTCALGTLIREADRERSPQPEFAAVAGCFGEDDGKPGLPDRRGGSRA